MKRRAKPHKPSAEGQEKIQKICHLPLSSTSRFVPKLPCKPARVMQLCNEHIDGFIVLIHPLIMFYRNILPIQAVQLNNTAGKMMHSWKLRLSVQNGSWKTTFLLGKHLFHGLRELQRGFLSWYASANFVESSGGTLCTCWVAGSWSLSAVGQIVWELAIGMIFTMRWYGIGVNLLIIILIQNAPILHSLPCTHTYMYNNIVW